MTVLYKYKYTKLYLVKINKIETSNSGSLGLIIDEERETKRY